MRIRRGRDWTGDEPASCSPEILADKKTIAKNSRYLRSATTRLEDYKEIR